MKTELSYIPKGGVCSRQIDIKLNTDGSIESVVFTGGCSGNTKGISSLLRGMNVKQAIERLRGIDCKGKGTSCPDQLSQALESCLD